MERQETPKKINDSVYEFYRGEDYKLEVVAFHGLCFDTYEDAYTTTWQDKDGTKCWLRDFIAEKCPEARVLSVSYDSCAKVSNEAGRMTFSNLGLILVQDLIHLAKVGQRGCPVVLIGYCLGGLVIEQLCIEAEKQYDQAPDGASKGRLDKFLMNVRSVLYLDTPHAGSSLGAYLRENHKCEGPVLEYLIESSTSLSSLNREFDSLVVERQWKRFICWYSSATKVWDPLKVWDPTIELPRGFVVVTEPSARRDEHFLYIKADHSGQAVSTAWSELAGVWDSLHEYTKQFYTKMEPIQDMFLGLKLNDSVYEFYRGEDYELEVVAFHGLCFDTYKNAYITTWLDKDERRCWLRDFIGKQHKKSRVLSVSYDSCAKKSSEGGKMPFSKLGRILVENVIHLAKVGKQGCPVVLIGYGLGGLVIQQLCVEAQEQIDEAPDPASKGLLEEFLKNVRAILYLDTPQAGSSLGDYLRKRHQCEGPVLEYLSESSASLSGLNRGFDLLIANRKWERFICWYSYATEVWNSIIKLTPGLEVVTELSARRDAEDFTTIKAGHSGKAVSTAWDDLVGVWNNLHEKVSEQLYLMYEPNNDGSNSNVELELIFFPETADDHAYESTWKSKDGNDCWLQTWLPKEFPRARILAVSLPVMDGEDIELKLNCDNLINDITSYHQSESWCPLFLVGHGKGGIVIKKLCNEVEKEVVNRPALEPFLRSVRGVAYYGTSHTGSHSEYSSGGITPVDVGRLNSDFKWFITNRGCKELILGETRPTQQGSSTSVIVDEFSASHGIERNSFFPVAADHSSICKPDGPLSNSFLYLKHFIHTTMQEAEYRNLNVRRKKRRGLAIIISMEDGRVGSDIDRRRFEDMADYINFEWKAIVDGEAEDLERNVQALLEQVKEEDECLLCCVSAHGFIRGGELFIYDTHNEAINLRPVVLTPVTESPKLVGKPKVLVINACREFEDSFVPKPEQIMPNADDCLLMYSCRLGEEGWRRTNGYEKGTLFVGEVTNQVKWLYRTTDVQDIFAEVKRRVWELAPEVGKEQLPMLHSSLSKRLSWRPR
ncbi:hypothetical protein R1sor_005452 [Riccia sorocarpa]|uniref:Uncharacterized protein n=1 Tax=Riccia sorocarpa TaxID=122646 RepID=A0ABD3HLK3_9MARC